VNEDHINVLNSTVKQYQGNCTVKFENLLYLRENNVIQTSAPLVNLQNMLSCTKGSLNHLMRCDSLKEKRGKDAVINIRSSACSVELVLMTADAMPF